MLFPTKPATQKKMPLRSIKLAFAVVERGSNKEERHCQ
jgi:hypothetical protein